MDTMKPPAAWTVVNRPARASDPALWYPAISIEHLDKDEAQKVLDGLAQVDRANSYKLIEI